MGIRIEKAWEDLTQDNIDPLPAQLGVYQIANADEQVVKIGMANALNNFGMRTALESEIESHPGQSMLFRYEINQQYTSRYDELLMVYAHDHGSVPEENIDERHRIGRLSPG